jgi:hypothetical protein
VRDVLKLRRRAPAWLNIPQMMRLTVTTHNVLEVLGDWEVARPYNFLLLPMVDPILDYAFDMRKNEKIKLVTACSPKQKRWFDLECVNIYDGKKYRMVNYNKEKNSPHNVVFPLQSGRLLVQYQEHPEAKSLARPMALHARVIRKDCSSVLALLLVSFATSEKRQIVNGKKATMSAS